MADVTFTVDAATGKAVRAYLKVLDAQKKIERQAGRVTTATKQTNTAAVQGAQDWSRANERVMGGLTQMLGALGMGVGIGGAMTAIVSLVKEWRENMKAIAETSADAGREMTAMALMQKEGEAGAAVQQAVAVGMKYGWSPGQSLSTAQRLQAQVGGLAPALEAMEEAGKLSQWAGVPPESATTAVSLGMALGLTPSQAAQAPYAAGEVSVLSAVELAEAAPKGLPGWRGTKGGPYLGYAVEAQLSEIEREPGRLGMLTDRARQALLGAGHEELWKKLRVEDASFIDRLKALRGAGITDELALEKAGFTELRQRFALNVLLPKIEDLERRHAEIVRMAETPGLLAGKRFAAEAELPQMEHTRVTEWLDAAWETERGFPASVTGRARQRRAEEISERWKMKRLAVERMGYGDLIGEEGDIGWRIWLRALYRASGELSDPAAVLGAGRNPLLEALTRIEQKAEELRRDVRPPALRHVNEDV